VALNSCQCRRLSVNKAKEKKCTLTYRIKGKGKKEIDFGDIYGSDDGRTVMCYKKLKATHGVDLPVKAYDFNAVWKDTKGDEVKVKETKFKWTVGKEATLTLKREKKDQPSGGMDEDDFAKLTAQYKVRDRPKCTMHLFRAHQIHATVASFMQSPRKGVAGLPTV